MGWAHGCFIALILISSSQLLVVYAVQLLGVNVTQKVCAAFSEKVIDGALILDYNPDQYVVERAEQDHVECFLFINTCRNCRIEIRFLRLDLESCTLAPSDRSTCLIGCDYLVSYESSYPNTTTQFYVSSHNNQSLPHYLSHSNSLTIKFCGSSTSWAQSAITIQYKAIEKNETYSGYPSDKNNTGVIRSPNFPHGYSGRQEVYTYLLTNNDKHGIVKVTFLDWHLTDDSSITIIDSSNKIIRYGNQYPPSIVSNSSSVIITFYTGLHQTYAYEDYMGFKLQYEFLSASSKSIAPLTDCGGYFYSQLGTVAFDSSSCPIGRVMKCVWVILRYKSMKFKYLSLRIQQYALDNETDFVAEHEGRTSDSDLVGIYREQRPFAEMVTDDDGVYFNLEVVCQPWKRFQVDFFNYAVAVNNSRCPHHSHYKCNNGRCIPWSNGNVLCDGINQCADDSDEEDCQDDTHSLDCKLKCLGTYSEYCVEQICDGVQNCQQAEDEALCTTVSIATSTPSGYRRVSDLFLVQVLPITLFCLIFFIVVCLIIARIGRKSVRNSERQQAAVDAARGGNVNINVNINNGVSGTREPHGVSTGEEPPSYDQVISYNARNGVVNMAYRGNESLDNASPPSYMSVMSEGNSDRGDARSCHAVPNTHTVFMISNGHLRNDGHCRDGISSMTVNPINSVTVAENESQDQGVADTSQIRNMSIGPTNSAVHTPSNSEDCVPIQPLGVTTV